VSDDTDISVSFDWRLPGHIFTAGLEALVFKNAAF
tara:strand:- start:13386 stop:13490 length:105 start_codon:yes stop_codon:yes gene_type:complete